MKKLLRILTAAFIIALCAGAFAACGNKDGTPAEKDIMVISREAGSGTRDAFDGFVKDPGDAAGVASLAKDKDNKTRTANIFVDTMIEVSATSSVKTLVAANTNAIGYMSLGSADGTVKTLKYGGVAASKATVADGTYKMQRPFVIMSNKAAALTGAAANFMTYLKSANAQTISDTFGCVKQGAGQTAYGETEKLTDAVGAGEKAVVIRGSTSVEPLMKLLIADYIKLNTGKIADANFDISCAGSGAGQTAVQNAGSNLEKTIGLSSSAFTHEQVNAWTICLDAVAVVVHKDNAALDNISSGQLFRIYTGAVKKFSALTE